MMPIPSLYTAELSKSTGKL